MPVQVELARAGPSISASAFGACSTPLDLLRRRRTLREWNRTNAARRARPGGASACSRHLRDQSRAVRHGVRGRQCCRRSTYPSEQRRMYVSAWPSIWGRATRCLSQSGGAMEYADLGAACAIEKRINRSRPAYGSEVSRTSRCCRGRRRMRRGQDRVISGVALHRQWSRRSLVAPFDLAQDKRCSTNSGLDGSLAVASTAQPPLRLDHRRRRTWSRLLDSLRSLLDHQVSTSVAWSRLLDHRLAARPPGRRSVVSTDRSPPLAARPPVRRTVLWFRQAQPPTVLGHPPLRRSWRGRGGACGGR